MALHQGRTQAPGGGIESNAGPGDAPTDHEDVEALRRQAPQGLGPVELSRRTAVAAGHLGDSRRAAGSDDGTGPACHSRARPPAGPGGLSGRVR